LIDAHEAGFQSCAKRDGAASSPRLQTTAWRAVLQYHLGREELQRLVQVRGVVETKRVRQLLCEREDV